MNAALTAKLDLKLTTTHVGNLIGANGQQLHIVGSTFVEVRFGEDDWRAPHEMQVTVVKDLCGDMIIGLDMLSTLYPDGRLNLTERTFTPIDGPVIKFENETLDVEQAMVHAVMNELSKHVAFIKPTPLTPASTALDFDTDLIKALPARDLWSTQQLERIETLIREFKSSFASDSLRVNQTTVASHTINTGSAEPIRERCRPTPASQVAIIEQAVQQMLSNGQIEKSNGFWASNALLVKKKDGTHRFCIDFRRVNGITAKEATLIPSIEPIFNQFRNGTNGLSQAVFSTIDLASGYWQIPIKDEESREKTSFITSSGIYRFKVMPFGLVNAPATFQRMMNELLQEHIGKFVHVYLDDICVFSENFDRHIDHLRTVFDIMKRANLQMRLGKCTFARISVPFLGHVISRDGIRPKADNIRSVSEFPVPTSVDQVRRFLGLSSYYRRFVPRFAAIAEPLIALTRKEVKFDWSRECSQAFNQLRRILTSEPVLCHVDFNKPFILKTDASQNGIGAVLAQEYDSHDCIDSDSDSAKAPSERVIAYASRILNAAERRYMVTEQEALAIVWALKHWRTTILGHEIKIVTDHQPLKWLLLGKETNSKLTRWGLIISEFGTVSIEYKSGESNADADALSRITWPDQESPVSATTAVASSSAPAVIAAVLTRKNNRKNKSKSKSTNATQKPRLSEDNLPELTRELNPGSAHRWSLRDLFSESETLEGEDEAKLKDIQFNLDQVRQAQQEDPDCQTWLLFKQDPANEKFKSLSQDVVTRLVATTSVMTVLNNILYHVGIPANSKRRMQWKPRLVVPRTLVEAVCSWVHDSITGAHVGIRRTYHDTRTRFYWNGMYEDIRTHVRLCIRCNEIKPSPKRTGDMISIHAQRPFDLVGIDVLGGLQPTPRNYTKIVVMVDHFSGYLVCVPVRNETADEIARAMFELIFKFGAPKMFLSDNGAPFIANANRALEKMLNIGHSFTTPYHPMSNGKTERANKSICKMLAAVVNDKKDDWDNWLPIITFAYNKSFNESVQDTPFSLVHGFDPVMPEDRMLGNDIQLETTLQDYRTETIERYYTALEQVAAARKKASEKQAAYFNKTMVHGPNAFRVGQLVWKYNSANSDGHRGKLDRRWEGPRRIIKVYDNNTVDLVKPGVDGTSRVNICFIRAFHGADELTNGYLPADEIVQEEPIKTAESTTTQQVESPGATQSESVVTAQSELISVHGEPAKVSHGAPIRVSQGDVAHGVSAHPGSTGRTAADALAIGEDQTSTHLRDSARSDRGSNKTVAEHVGVALRSTSQSSSGASFVFSPGLDVGESVDVATSTAERPGAASVAERSVLGSHDRSPTDTVEGVVDSTLPQRARSNTKGKRVLDASNVDSPRKRQRRSSIDSTSLTSTTAEQRDQAHDQVQQPRDASKSKKRGKRRRRLVPGNGKTTPSELVKPATTSVAKEDEYFLVDDILAERRNEKGETEYHVRWLGYTKSHDSWVPAHQFQSDEPIRLFEQRQAISSSSSRTDAAIVRGTGTRRLATPKKSSKSKNRKRSGRDSVAPVSTGLSRNYRTPINTPIPEASGSLRPQRTRFAPAKYAERW